jgi:hypothetical protein
MLVDGSSLASCDERLRYSLDPPERVLALKQGEGWCDEEMLTPIAGIIDW